MQGDERSRAQRGGDRDGERFGEPARHPAAAKRRAQGRDDREHRDDRREAQLPAGVLGGARVVDEGDGGREQQRIPARSRPSGECRHEACDSHDRGALDRRPGTRERDVRRDERDREPQARREAEPGERPEREDERREQEHVRPARRYEVGKPGGAEVLPERLGQRAILAEHHPAGERALLGREASREGALRAGADPVERA